MKRIVIAGASSGIGLAVARLLAERGARLGLMARHTGSLQELAREFPGTVHYTAADITLPDATEKMLGLAERIGGMDIYLHVAGIGYDNPSMDPEREAAMIQTNAAAFARMTSAAYNYMRRQGKGGLIAAVTSVAATKGIGTMAAYSASKKCAQTYLDALDQLSRIQRAGVRVCDIRPGWVDTPLLHAGRAYPLQMSSARAARLIVRAVDREKRVAYIDWRWRVVASLWRAVPGWLWRRMRLKIGS